MAKTNKVNKFNSVNGFILSLALHLFILLLLFFNFTKPHNQYGGLGHTNQFEGNNIIGGGGGGRGLNKNRKTGFVEAVDGTELKNQQVDKVEIEVQYVEATENFRNIEPQEELNVYLKNELTEIEKIKQKIQESEQKNEIERVARLQQLQKIFTEDKRKEIKDHQLKIQKSLDAKLNEQTMPGEKMAGQLDASEQVENTGKGEGDGIGLGEGTGNGKFAGSGNGDGRGFGNGIGDGIDGGGLEKLSKCSGTNPNNRITVHILTSKIDRKVACSGQDSQGRCILKYGKQRNIVTAGANQFLLYYAQFPAIFDFSESGKEPNMITIIGHDVSVKGLNRNQYTTISPDSLNAQYPQNVQYDTPWSELDKSISDAEKYLQDLDARKEPQHIKELQKNSLTKSIKMMENSKSPQNELARVYHFAREKISYLRCFNWGGGVYTPIQN